MGNNNSSNSCQNNPVGPNYICDISKCTEKVVGLSSNSASPSDIWILTLNPGTRYGNIVVNGEVVLKIFISNSTDRYITKSIALVYESAIYEFVVGSMFKKNINPHFVPYYGRALNCSRQQLVNILDKNVDEKYRQMAIDYNTTYYAFQIPQKNRMSVTDVLNARFNSFSVDRANRMNHLVATQKNFGYGMIVTAKSNGRPFSEFFKTEQVQQQGQPYIRPTRDTMLVLIQIISGLCAMTPFECAHNDLHMGNIFVNRKPKNELPFAYQYDSNIYTLNFDNKKYHAAIYDWDRAYCPHIGNNPIHTDLGCKQYMNCNEFIPKRDTLKILTYVMMEFIRMKQPEFTFTHKLLDIIWIKPEGKRWFITNVLQAGNPYFLVKPNNTTMTSKDFSSMNGPYEILTKLLEYCNSEFPSSVTKHTNIPSGHILYNFTYDTVLRDVKNFTTLSQNELSQVNKEPPSVQTDIKPLSPNVPLLSDEVCDKQNSNSLYNSSLDINDISASDLDKLSMSFKLPSGYPPIMPEPLPEPLPVQSNIKPYSNNATNSDSLGSLQKNVPDILK